MTAKPKRSNDIDIDQIPFFSGLSPAESIAVKNCFREKTFKKGECLSQEGNTCERIFFIKTGRVKIYRLGSSGREQILELLGPGDTCACNPGTELWSCSSTAEALTPCTVWFLAREHYADLVQNNRKLAHSLIRLFAGRLQCFGDLIEEISLKDSQKRVVKFLLDAAKRDGAKIAVAAPFTREELAQRIGLARETATRQLHSLKRKKLINILILPKEILILDPAGLARLLTK